VDLPLLHRVAQRAHHRLLADHVGERPGAVSAVERGSLGHGGPSLASPPARSGRAGEARVDRAPSVEAGSRARLRPWLRPGLPAAPAGNRLRLLPSGSDLVHGPTTRGTRPSTPAAGALAAGAGSPSGGDSAPLERIAGTGHRYLPA